MHLPLTLSPNTSPAPRCHSSYSCPAKALLLTESSFHALRKSSSPTQNHPCVAKVSWRREIFHTAGQSQGLCMGTNQAGPHFHLLSCQQEKLSIGQKVELCEGNQHIYSINHTQSRKVQQCLDLHYPLPRPEGKQGCHRNTSV